MHEQQMDPFMNSMPSPANITMSSARNLHQSVQQQQQQQSQSMAASPDEVSCQFYELAFFTPAKSNSVFFFFGC